MANAGLMGFGLLLMRNTPAMAAQGAGVFHHDTRCLHVGLNQLRDYDGGRAFKQRGYVLAYFATPYSIDPDCGADVSGMAVFLDWADKVSEVTPALVFVPPKEGDPSPDFANSYAQKNQNARVQFEALTADRDIIFKTARQARLPFRLDAGGKKIQSHARGAALIAPDGQLLKVYTPEFISNVPNSSADFVHHLESHKRKSLQQSCDFD